MGTFYFRGRGTLQSSLLTEAARSSEQVGQSKHGRFAFYRTKLFPSAGTLKYRYKVLNRYPWLLPVVWVIRILDILLVKRTARSKLKTFGEVVTQENIDQRRKTLEYLGLDGLL